MTEMNGDTTVEAKQAFERIASKYGVKVRHYHADNGLFDTKTFWSAVESANQTMSFCGVNAHHQNGKAENRVKDVTTNARTSLLHASHRWPKAIHASLWPAAVKNYVNLRNNIPRNFKKGDVMNGDKLPDTFIDSPLSKFSGAEVDINLKHYHPFGSPVYVLEDKLQKVHAHNKWEDRSKVGIFLCHSPNHSSSVPLVLNTSTGMVTPQFHCLYDDEFATCKADTKFRSLWQHKARVNHDKVKVQKGIKVPYQSFIPIQHMNQPTQDNDSLPPNFIHPWESTGTQNEPTASSEASHQKDASSVHQNEKDDNKTTTRSGRVIRSPDRLTYSAVMSFISTFSPPLDEDVSQQLLQPDNSSKKEPHPFALVTEYLHEALIATDPDTMHLQEALRQSDRDKFLEAMEKELRDHIKRKHWKVIPLKHVPKNKVCIPMIWSMKRKRNPLGEVTRYKARLCTGGHKSVEFVDYWSTYSPVVSWHTVRLVFTLALVNDWHIRSIDFVLAYPQAEIKTDIYMRPPRVPPDFNIPDLPLPTDRLTKAYQLLKNLYGLKDAGRT